MFSLFKKRSKIPAQLAAQVDAWIRELHAAWTESAVPPCDAASIERSYQSSLKVFALQKKLLGAFESFDEDDPVAIELECRLHIANLRSGQTSRARIIWAFRSLKKSDPVQYARLKRYYAEAYGAAYGIETEDGRRMVATGMPCDRFEVFREVENA